MRKPHLDYVLRGSTSAARAHAPAIIQWLEGFAERLKAQGDQPKITTGRPTRGPYALNAWRRSAAAMKAGKLRRLGIGVDRGDGRHASAIWWHDLSHPSVDEITFEATYDRGEIIPWAEFVALAQRVAEASGLANGLLVAAGVHGLDATYTDVEAKGARFGPNALERYVRGPGWGLWLTACHLEGLGGRARVLREAPVHRIVERPTGLWLELTADPWDVPEEALARLASYLAPITPTVEQVHAVDPLGWPPPEEVEAVTEADAYADYAGPPLRFEWLLLDGDTVPINVHLAQQPAPEVAAALERAVLAWYNDGAQEAYGPGGFHDLRGPDWDELTVRWDVDMGPADYERGLDDLTRRLAGWSAKWKCPVAAVRLGMEEP
ncbi:MAG: hypothetical protein HY690_04890 [Chloroflexi bacterium]|nr:hypothetical protein [Chloroflexota bacterium]